MTTWSADDRPRVKDDLVVHEIDGEVVVFDRSVGGLHHLNASATAVFLACDGDATAEELSREVAHAFGVPTADIQADILPLLDRLTEAGLLVPPGGCRGC